MKKISQESSMNRFTEGFTEQASPLRRKNQRLAVVLSAARLLATTGLVALLIGLGWILATGDEAALTRLICLV
jgi:hypothetical protein